MKVTLNKPFASNGKVDEYDVRQMKVALNHLGYYMPYEKTGITDMPDRSVFTALKEFQKDHGLTPTGSAKPGDDTVKTINNETKDNKDRQYIWCTMRDADVRDEHAAMEGEKRYFSEFPAPGEEPNCRCWGKLVQEAEGLSQELISEVNDAEKKWTSLDFLRRYFFGDGNEVTLEHVGYLGDIISKAEEVMYKNLEDQIADKMRNIKNGVLTYRTENSYPRLGEVKWVFGGGTIRTITAGHVTQDGNIVFIDAEIKYEYYDEFTDITNIRQLFLDPHYFADLPDNWAMAIGVTVTEIVFGKMYPIVGNWKTKLTGSISLDEE